MSFFSTPISPTSPAVPATGASAPATGPRPTTSTPSTPSVMNDTMPASPPSEVLDAIGTAADAYQRLAASGQRLHFDTDAPTGKVTVSVTDLAGNVLRTLSPSEALDVAAGQPLPEQ